MSLSFSGYQVNKCSKILVLQVAASFLWSIQFLLLGALTGSAMTLLTALRNLAFYKSSHNRKAMLPVVFGLIYLVAALITWQGARSWLPLLGTLSGSLAFWQTEPKRLRLFVLISPPLWFAYNVISGSYAWMAADIIGSTSVLLAIYRFDLGLPKTNPAEATS